MGTGKTITSIAIAGKLYLDNLITRALIVAPLSIVGVWDEEFSKFADFPYKLAVLNGSGAKKAETLKSLTGQGLKGNNSTREIEPLQIAVVNYESAWRLEKELAAWLTQGGGSVVICDEGHKIKSHNISASKAMHRIGARADYRLLLTGTVITNKAIDVFSQYKFLNPAIFGNSFYSFRNRYFDMVGYGQHTPVLKKSMEPELMRKMHSIAFRATKAECLDLPAMTDIVRTVELEPAAMKVYRDLVKESFAELGNDREVTATNILTRLLRLSQLTGGFIGDAPSPTAAGGRGREGEEGRQPGEFRSGSEKGDLGCNPSRNGITNISRAKLNALSDILEEAQNEGRKLVVIARFVPEIKAICSMLEKSKIGYTLIMGGVTDREEQVSRFQNDPNCTVFVGQIATAGLGITLTAASTLVFYSTDYSMSNHEQARARIHRVGQKENCTYIYLTAKGTVDEKVLKALKNKADLAKSLVDDYRQGINPFQ